MKKRTETPKGNNKKLLQMMSVPLWRLIQIKKSKHFYSFEML